MNVPLGKPLQLTDKELAEAAKVTDENIEKAKKLWKQFAPDEFIDLLDAEKVNE